MSRPLCSLTESASLDWAIWVPTASGSRLVNSHSIPLWQVCTRDTACPSCWTSAQTTSNC
ncbi:hypothetical protein PHET_08826 [Paragonimus heterotremus]|uniref:Uncharacterized protein n=1 Tax=Paragonimus heterotremus TaxID=100268 RepID=A0A8J4WF81_9TREM|nr:hypothetical protein PHET_08826 [Paragonimus heterotremus]